MRLLFVKENKKAAAGSGLPETFLDALPLFIV